jgi:hypothetical protein
LGDLTRGLGRLRKLNRLITISIADQPIDIGSTGQKNQWKKLIYGKPDDPKRSEEVIVIPPTTEKKFVDVNGVGNGMGDDYDDFGYYQDLSGLNNVDGIGVDEPSFVQKRTPDAPSYEVPSRPGISPFEVRIVEAVGKDVLAYHPSSVEERRDAGSSKWTKRPAPVQERGEGVDTRSHKHRTQTDGGYYSAKQSRQQEAILDGYEDAPQYQEVRRGGGHTIIQDNGYDGYDSDFRYGSGLFGQSHLGDLGFSLPFGIKPPFGLKPPKFPPLPDIPNPKELLEGGKDLIGTFFSKGLEIVKLIIEKLTGLKDSFFWLITKAKDKAMDFASRGLKQAFDRAQKIKDYATKMVLSLAKKIDAARKNAIAFAKRYAIKAYKLAKQQAQKAYSLSKKYTNKAYQATKRNMGKLKNEVMKPLKSLNQRYENFKQLVTYGALAILALAGVGGAYLMLR